MSLHDLASLGAGFSHESFGSQAIFRCALNALSQPGRCVTVEHDAQVPRSGKAAGAVLLLALLDSDCTLWLSPSLQGSDAAAWLRFHTGCQMETQPDKAMFAWVGEGDALPLLSSFSQGSDSEPDFSATCIIDVPQMHTDANIDSCWTLSGPGIQNLSHLTVEGLPEDFVLQWAANHAGFPRGVDLFLATQTQLLGLPRTTSIQLSGGL